MLEVKGNLNDFIQESNIIDFSDPDLLRIAEKLRCEAEDDTDLIRRTFEYVRDQIGL